MTSPAASTPTSIGGGSDSPTLIRRDRQMTLLHVKPGVSGVIGAVLSATQFVNRRSLQVATASGRAPRLPKSCPYSPRFGTEGNGPSPNAAVLHSSALIPTPV